MLERLEALLQLIAGIPVEMVYVLVGLGAAVENIFPPVPSDLAVLAGGILAERGLLQADIVFLVAWLSNLALALGVYLAAYRYGAGVFSSRWGRWLLRPTQLHRMSEFYDEYGTITVLVSRFFPVFRVLVPAFAGISRLGFWRTAIPLMIASAAGRHFLFQKPSATPGPVKHSQYHGRNSGHARCRYPGVLVVANQGI